MIVLDNYELSRPFEHLAIKIVKEYLNIDLDQKKTKVTRKTRDYGVDSYIYFENETETIIRTIEAKLRNNKYTLALKDIASSILFFIIRHGDEHYIVTNVYLTEGTKQAISGINECCTGNIQFIDGITTKNIVSKILPKIHKVKEKKEYQLAEKILSEFSKLKIPKQQKSISNKKPDPILEELLKSRVKIKTQILEELQRNKIIVLKGALGVGKNLVLRSINDTLVQNDYTIINIPANSTNLISEFCYTIAEKLFNFDINSLLKCSVADNEMSKGLRTESEKEQLELMRKIFDASTNSYENAKFLAKKYLINLFQIFNKKIYVIEIENYQNVSCEIFHLIEELITLLPNNIKFLFTESNSMPLYNNFFSSQFKQINHQIYKEFQLTEFNEEEGVLYIQKLNCKISESGAKEIFSYFGGNPALLRESIKTTVQNPQISWLANYNFTDLHTCYSNKICVSMRIPEVRSLYFLITVLGELKQSNIKHYFTATEKNTVLKEIEESNLFSVNFGTISFRSQYIKDIIEQKLLSYKDNINLCYEKKYSDFTFVDSLEKIVFCYYTDNSNIIDIYESSKQSWNHKTNIHWQNKALGYICLFLKDHLTDCIKCLEFCGYANQFVQTYTFNNEKIYSYILKLLNSNISEIERSFELLPKHNKNKAASVLFDYYININVKLQNDKNKIHKIILSCKVKKWFAYITEYQSIVYIRKIALSYKELGNRSEYDNLLKKLLLYNHPYAKFAYYANQAAKFYIENPYKAEELLSNCPFQESPFKDINVQMMQLWVGNDWSIISFYKNDIERSQEIAERVLESSNYISDYDNMARSYNILALIQLKKHCENDAIEKLRMAITYALHSNKDSLMHFCINYLNICYDEKVEKICWNYFKTNHHILIKFMQAKPLNNRWYTSLTAFSKILKKQNQILFKEFNEIFKDFSFDQRKVSPKYEIENSFYVLF